jgi:hypothetical protein
MKQILKRITTGMAWSLIVLAGTSIAAAPEASAHGNDKVRYVDYDRYVHKRSAREFPRWLRGKRNFQRWYVRSHYRNMRRLNWERLYDLYLYDTRRARRASKYKNAHDHYYWYDEKRSGREHNRRRRG